MQITIDKLLPLLRKGYVAMNKDGEWCYYGSQPRIRDDNDFWSPKNFHWEWLGLFDIAPFDGDWKQSLMKCGHTATVKDGE